MCVRNLRVSYPRVDVLVQEHQNLLDLLEVGDNEGLQQAISLHMRTAVDDLTATTLQD
jgi:DNA-binding GntR family transcriptional regulator